MQNALESGLTVVMDRYLFSGVAYTHAKDPSSLPWDWCCACDTGLPLPDLVLYLDVSAAEQGRRADFGGERYEEGRFQAAVRSCFVKWRDVLPDVWRVIDADRSVAEVHGEIVRAVEECEGSVSSLDRFIVYYQWCLEMNLAGGVAVVCLFV